MVRLMKNDGKTSMTMIMDGHEVSLHFAEKPNVQSALKIKRALLGAFLTGPSCTTHSTKASCAAAKRTPIIL